MLGQFALEFRVAITGALGEDKSLSNERDAPKEHDQTSPKIL